MRLEGTLGRGFRETDGAPPEFDEELFAPMLRGQRPSQLRDGADRQAREWNRFSKRCSTSPTVKPWVSARVQPALAPRRVRLDMPSGRAHLPQEDPPELPSSPDAARWWPAMAFQETDPRPDPAGQVAGPSLHRKAKRRWTRSGHIMSTSLHSPGWACSVRSRMAVSFSAWLALVSTPELRPVVSGGPSWGGDLKPKIAVGDPLRGRPTGEGRRRLSVCARDLYRTGGAGSVARLLPSWRNTGCWNGCCGSSAMWANTGTGARGTMTTMLGNARRPWHPRRYRLEADVRRRALQSPHDP